MKTIEIKHGAKTTIKIVTDDYTELEYELEQKDLTTSERKSIGFIDVPRNKWENIFKKNKKSSLLLLNIVLLYKITKGEIK